MDAATYNATNRRMLNVTPVPTSKLFEYPSGADCRVFTTMNTQHGAFRLATLIALGTSGVTTFLTMPIVAAALSNRLHISDGNIGIFSTIQLIAVSAGCFASVVRPHADIRRSSLVMLTIMLICDALCIIGLPFTAFVIVRAIASCAGGIVVSRATAAMGKTSNSQRSFGLFLALQTVIAVVCVYAMPPLIAHVGFGGAYLILAIYEFVTMALVWSGLQSEMQRIEPGVVRPKLNNDPIAWLQCGGFLGSMLCFFIGVGALWTFLALLSQRTGLSEDKVDSILTISKMVAFMASFLPGLVGIRLGRNLPIIVSVAMLAIAMQIMADAATFWTFAAGTALFSFGWYTLYPYQLSFLAEVDRDGRPLLASAALTSIGLGLGPALVTVGGGDITTRIYSVSTVAFIGAALLAISALALPRFRQRLSFDSAS